MGILLSGADIIDLAVQTEVQGEAFYREAVSKADTKEARDLFTYLAEQEKQHKLVFSQMGDSIVIADLEPAEWQEALDYINATVSQTFFSDGTPIRAIPDGSTVREMVERAIDFEQQTLLFFYTLRDMVKPANRALVDSIVAEERIHVRRLAAMRKAQ